MCHNCLIELLIGLCAKQCGENYRYHCKTKFCCTLTLLGLHASHALLNSCGLSNTAHYHCIPKGHIDWVENDCLFDCDD